MLKALPQYSSRTVASGSSSSFHSSAILQALSFKRRKSRAIEKANSQRRAEREHQAQANRPHVVVGYRPGDVAKWTNSDLAKVLVSQGDIVDSTIQDLPTGSVSLPNAFNYGIGEKEKELLFKTLPQLTVLNTTRGIQGVDVPERGNEAMQMEEFKMKAMARIVSLRNANAKGIAYENRKRIVQEFSEPANPEDTGRPEVQAALLTYKIRNLWDHLQRFKSDVGNRRGLTKLIHQRAKILKYLKRTDRDRYAKVLQRLGLEAEAVEGELVVV